MSKRKKKRTSKNTHIKRVSKNEDVPRTGKWYDKVVTWIAIVAAIILIILIALDNHIIGYDNFVGIPREWIRSLFD